MNPKQIETIKFIGGALVVAAAGLIMFPGFLTVATGVGKIILMIVIAGGACLSLAYATHIIRRQRKPSESASPATPPESHSL